MAKTYESLDTKETRRELANAKAKLRENPADRLTELTIERLTKQLSNSELHDQRVADLNAKREAEAQEREQQAAADLELRLKAQYIAAAPGTTETEAEQALPDLLHKHRLEQMNEFGSQVARARRSGAYSI